MRTFYVITNDLKDPNHEMTERICNYVKLRGGKTICSGGDLTQAQAILVVGGDGTMLQAVSDTIHTNLAMIGINMGTLGYLTEIEPAHLEEALDQLFKDDFIIEDRMMLHGETEVKGKTALCGEALNDIVITRNGSLAIVNYSVYVNGKLLKNFSADGCIIATPTGSTGYNLSAGGPIVEPKAQIILVTPVCPHTTNTRPIILSPEDEIWIEVDAKRDGSDQKLDVIFDGGQRMGISTGDRVIIRRSSETTKIIKLDQGSFLQVLHSKMK